MAHYSLCTRRTDKSNAYWPLPYGRGHNKWLRSRYYTVEAYYRRIQKSQSIARPLCNSRITCSVMSVTHVEDCREAHRRPVLTSIGSALLKKLLHIWHPGRPICAWLNRSWSATTSEMATCHTDSSPRAICMNSERRKTGITTCHRTDPSQWTQTVV